MCRVLNVARAGFYVRPHNPISARELSGGVYGYRRIHGDLNEIGETCGKNRVGRIMQLNRIKAVRGYKAPRRIAGRPFVVVPNCSESHLKSHRLAFIPFSTRINCK